MNDFADPSPPTRSGLPRNPTIDIVRVVALLGIIVLNYHGYLNRDRALGVGQDSLFLRLMDPWNGALVVSPVLFVVVAGISCALLTDDARRSGTARAIGEMRWVLVRRGVLLLLGGMIFEWVWPGTILPYFGTYFLLASVTFAWPSTRLMLLAAATAVSAALLSLWRYVRWTHGHSTAWLSPSWIASPRDLVFRLFIDYTHPVLPWFAYFLVGTIVGRNWDRFVGRRRRSITIALATSGVGFLVGELSLHLSGGAVQHVLSTDPFDRGLLATGSLAALAVALIGVITALADRWRSTEFVRGLAAIGAMSLTMYVLHGLWFNLVVHWLEWISPAGFDSAFALSISTWLGLLAVARLWTTRLGRGPLERLLRGVGG